MEKNNSVFIGTSLDGYIADGDGGLDWLNSVPNPDNIDMGYGEFTSQIDAIVMGRTTFETVCGFDIEWPYQKPVFVLSNTLTEIPGKFKDKVQLVKGTLVEILEKIHKQGFYRLYIDGGKVIQSFLKEDLIDDLIITIIPTLLGAGTSLFSDLPNKLDFECIESKLYPGEGRSESFQTNPLMKPKELIETWVGLFNEGDAEKISELTTSLSGK